MFKGSGLGKKYGRGQNSVLALRNANFSFPDKGVVGIKGRSGSGKSTLLMVLATLCRPTSGRLWFRKKDVGGFRGRPLWRFRRDEIGIVYQHYNLFEDLSLEENVAYPLMLAGIGKKEAINRARKLLAKLLDERLFAKKPGECSGGEKQRASIARALINEPKAILADEPTGALDEVNGQAVMELLRSLGDTRLIVIVSHSPELDSYCDYVMEMEEGKLMSPISLPNSEDRFAKRAARARWTLLLEMFKRSVREDFKHLSSAFICCLLGFASLLLGFAFFVGNGASISKARVQSADAGTAFATISKPVSVDDYRLTLIKNERPSLDVVGDAFNGLGEYIFCPDYSFLFPEQCEASFNGQEIECSFSPIYDFGYLDEYGLPYEGTVPFDGSLSHCVVNDAFVKKFGCSLPLNPILLHLKSSLSGEGWDHDFFMPLSLTPTAVIKEFSFMNSPRVYYSYNAFQIELGNTIIEGLSQLIDRPVSIRELCLNADSDSPFSNYRYSVFAKNKASLQPLFELSEALSNEDSPLRIISRAYSSYEAFRSVSASLETCMFFFGAVEVLLCGCIAVLNAFICFRRHRRRTAIAISLGASPILAVTGFSSASIMTVLLGCLASIPFSHLMIYILNIIFFRMFRLEALLGFSNMGHGHLLAYGSAIGLALLIGILVYALSLLLLWRLPLDSEMKDE